MPAHDLLIRLEGVRQTGPGRFLARCPAHPDRRPSLSVRETDDGVILLHDFGGCSVPEILGALGMDVAELFPERPEHHRPASARRRVPAADALRAVAFEGLVVLAAARTLAAGQSLLRTDRERLLQAVGRLQSALDESCPSWPK
jgi:hypothetical protein